MSAPNVSYSGPEIHIPKDVVISRSSGHLLTRIEQQPSEIRVQQHGRPNHLLVQEQAQTAEYRRRELYQRVNEPVAGDKHELLRRQENLRRLDRVGREQAGTQAILAHKANVANDAGDQLLQRGDAFNQQDEQRCQDRLPRDGSATQTQRAEKDTLLKITETRRLAEERKMILAIMAERERKQPLDRKQGGQGCGEAGGRDQACLREFDRHTAAARVREQRQLIARQKDDQRRREREARDQAGLRAIQRHEAATKLIKAQQAEERRLARVRKVEQRKLAKLREAEQKRALRDQERELRRIEKQKRDDAKREAGVRHKSAVRKAKEEHDLLREQVERQRDLRSLRVAQRQTTRTLQEEDRRRDRQRRDEAGRQAIQRHNQRHHAALQAQKAHQRPLTEGGIAAFNGVLPSFLEEEYQYMKQASSDFPEMITSSIQMGCMETYHRAIVDASSRLPCGLCGGLFQGDEMLSVGLEDDNLQYFLQRTRTAPDCCALKDDMVSLCGVCSSAITKRNIPLLSAGNFVNCLFCQDYPDVLKNLNAVEEAFIARAHVVGIFLKLTSGAKKGISYRGSRGHSVAVRQDPSELLKILPTRRLQDHTTITVSWDRGSPPSEENLGRFCSVDKAKVLNALLWLCVNNSVYKSVVIDYSVLDSWPDYHIPQEIRDAFITLGSESGSHDALVEDERAGYAASLRNGLFENELDAEVEDTEAGTILSRSFFSDLHGQYLHSTPATLASLQAILQDRGPDDLAPNGEHITNDPDGEAEITGTHSPVPHISYKTPQELPLMNSFTDPVYFTAAFPTLFPFGIGGHLGDAKGSRPEEVSLKAFAKYAMLHHSLL